MKCTNKIEKSMCVYYLDDDDNFVDAKITQKRLNSITAVQCTDDSEDLQMTFYRLVFNTMS